MKTKEIVELVEKMLRTERYYLGRAKEEERNIKIFEYSSSLLKELLQKIKS